MNLLQAFVQLSSDAIFHDGLSSMDVHSLACAHRAIQKAVDERLALKNVARPSPDDIRQCTDQLEAARSALLGDVELTKTLAEIQERRKAAFRQFVELSKRRKLPFSKGVCTELSGDIYSLLSSSRSVSLEVTVMGLWINVESWLGNTKAYVATAPWSKDAWSLPASWRESLALAVAIVTHFFAVPLTHIVVASDLHR